MILEIENKIIDDVQTFYATQNVDISISSDFEEYPEEFPALMIRQISCSAYQRTQDDALEPHHYRVVFRLNTFSNKTTGAKTEVKRLMELNDRAMTSCKFTLTQSEITTNFDRSITMGTQAYTAIIGTPQTIGGDEVYQMYR